MYTTSLTRSIRVTVNCRGSVRHGHGLQLGVLVTVSHLQAQQLQIPARLRSRPLAAWPPWQAQSPESGTVTMWYGQPLPASVTAAAAPGLGPRSGHGPRPGPIR
jgi:hypothetical protein